MNEINEKIGLFLEKYLKEYKAENRGNKVIHDPLWGSNLFYSWEIAVIDSPIFQRLRRVHQTGTALFTYPTSSHSRFTHSLGVVILADRLLRKLQDPARSPTAAGTLSSKDIYEVRIAALLHDIGHCFFSHTSEQILGKMAIIHEVKKEEPFRGSDAIALHEIFAYYVLNHEIFINFWQDVKKMFDDKGNVPDLSNIAKIIIGKDISPEKRFLTEIITGPYDVDKLEYLYRDGYNAGINLAYDIERFFYRIKVADTSKYSGVKNEHRMVMDLAGVTAIEQLVFSKMMLYSYMYHHQKVRCADCLIRDIIRTLLNEDHPLIRTDNIIDFLNYTDFDILSCFAADSGTEIDFIIKKLQNRDLLKRCFVVCRDYVVGFRADDKVAAAYERLCTHMRDILGDQIELRQKILEQINSRSGKKYNLHDFYIDMPELPLIEEAARSPVQLPNQEIEPMSEYFQLEGWQKIYEIKKLRGYFFVKSEIVDLANEVIRQFIQKEYGLTFTSMASQMAKVVN